MDGPRTGGRTMLPTTPLKTQAEAPVEAVLLRRSVSLRYRSVQRYADSYREIKIEIISTNEE